MTFPLSHHIIADVPPTGRSSRPGAIRFYEQDLPKGFHAARTQSGHRQQAIKFFRCPHGMLIGLPARGIVTQRETKPCMRTF